MKHRMYSSADFKSSFINLMIHFTLHFYNDELKIGAFVLIGKIISRAKKIILSSTKYIECVLFLQTVILSLAVFLSVSPWIGTFCYCTVLKLCLAPTYYILTLCCIVNAICNKDFFNKKNTEMTFS